MVLNAVFTSPSRLYSLRYNRSWSVQEINGPTGPLDYFTLPDASFSVAATSLQPGTTLAGFTQATLQSYRQVNLSGLSQEGSIEIGGGQGMLLRATTYVNAAGQTVATPPSPDAPAHTLYQALYVIGSRGFTFSIAWPQRDSTDYLSLFRSMLRSFTLAGVN